MVPFSFAVPTDRLYFEFSTLVLIALVLIALTPVILPSLIVTPPISPAAAVTLPSLFTENSLAAAWNAPLLSTKNGVNPFAACSPTLRLYLAFSVSALTVSASIVVCAACASLIPITPVRANAAKKATAHVRARFPFPCLFAISETTV